MAEIRGPKFQVEADKALIVLGQSERKEVGEYLAKTLDERGIFEDIDILTLGKSAALLGRASLRKAMESRTVITHSAGILRVPKALQVIALNPPEPVPLGKLLRRAFVDIGKEDIKPEPGAHKTGFADQMKAGLEMARNPVVTSMTTLAISGGYSTSERLAFGEEDFPAGRAMVHSELDAFGFAGLADMRDTALFGVTTVMLPDQYHNEVLFAPNETIDQLTPVIFPQS